MSVDVENGTVSCSDGNEYPLLGCLESLPVTELERHMNRARRMTTELLKGLSADD